MKESNAKGHIVKITEADAIKVIELEIGESIEGFSWFKDGYFSRALLFKTKNGERLVARFGNDARGYEKDRFATKHFASSKVPIPSIKIIKQLKSGMWLCLSEYVEGVGSEKLHGQMAQAAIRSVQETIIALHSTTVDMTVGFGELDENGRANYSSMSEYLTRDYCTRRFYNDISVDEKLVKQAWKIIGELSKFCPTDRFLVHNDIGSDNLLIKDNKVVAVLDWEFSLIGDWVIDIARFQDYPLEIYGDFKAAYEKAGFDCSNWDIRIVCYRLHTQIGLIHWIWSRQQQGIKSWQTLADAQVDLRIKIQEAESILGR